MACGSGQLLNLRRLYYATVLKIGTYYTCCTQYCFFCSEREHFHFYIVLENQTRYAWLLKCKLKRRFRYFWCSSNFCTLLSNSNLAILLMNFRLRQVTIATCTDYCLSNNKIFIFKIYKPVTDCFDFMPQIRFYQVGIKLKRLAFFSSNIVF